MQPDKKDRYMENAIFSIKHSIKNVEYNINYYEKLSEHILSDEDKKTTINDLKYMKAEYEKAIVILSNSNKKKVNHCEECSKELKSGTVFCTHDCRVHYYRD